MIICLLFVDGAGIEPASLRHAHSVTFHPGILTARNPRISSRAAGIIITKLNLIHEKHTLILISLVLNLY